MCHEHGCSYMDAVQNTLDACVVDGLVSVPDVVVSPSTMIQSTVGGEWWGYDHTNIS